MPRIARDFTLSALIVVLISTTAWAQATAQLNGRVTDESGAVLPGVTVTATQTDTGLTRTAVTDDTGAWVITKPADGSLQVGDFAAGLQDLRADRPRAAGWRQPDDQRQPGCRQSRRDRLQSKPLAPLVDVRSAGISDVVENERIVELPLQGRQVTDLIVLAGAAVEQGRPNSRSFQGGVNISVAGGLFFGVGYTLDGAMHNDIQSSSGLPLPFPDALQEFRVATSGPQRGKRRARGRHRSTRSPGRAPTHLHGNAFEFLRDKKFNATSVFAAVNPATGKRRAMTGSSATSSGARSVDQSSGIARVLLHGLSSDAHAPDAGRQHRLCADRCDDGGRLHDVCVTRVQQRPTNRPPRAVRQQPRGCVRSSAPAALNLAKRLPTTTDPCGETRFSLPSDRDETQTIGRLDYQRSTNHSLFGRYMYTTDKRPAPFEKSDNVLTTTTSAVDNYAQSLNPRRHARILGVEHRQHAAVCLQPDGGGPVSTSRSSSRTTSDSNVYNYSPTREMVLTVHTAGFNISASTATRGIADNKTFQLAEDFTAVRGRHQLAFGANVARWNTLQKSWAQGGGTWTFNGSISGLGLADFSAGGAWRSSSTAPTSACT
jgi:hypothetical protein